MIRALIFDFGQVISAQKPAALFHRYERELGLEPDTINDIMFQSAYWQQALLGKSDWPTYWHKIGSALNLHGPEEVDAFRQRYHRDERINEGVLRLLQRYAGTYKLAVLSNHPPGLSAWLIDWGIDRYFDLVFCSGDEGVVKPDPQVYLMTIERLGVRPREAAFIDDTPGHVAAAIALGLHGIVFTQSATLEGELARLLPQE